jgi:hypothetical protein
MRPRLPVPIDRDEPGLCEDCSRFAHTVVGFAGRDEQRNVVL